MKGCHDVGGHQTLKSRLFFVLSFPLLYSWLCFFFFLSPFLLVCPLKKNIFPLFRNFPTYPYPLSLPIRSNPIEDV